eukprot:7698052-Ditylum_brightwellii.AAC.1
MMDEEQQHREIDDVDVKTLIAPDDLSHLAVRSLQGGDKKKYKAKGNEDCLVKILDEYFMEVGHTL